MNTRDSAGDRHTAAGNGQSVAGNGHAVTAPAGTDLSLVDLLVEDGHLSPDQIRHATRVQAKLVASRTLLEVLQQLGSVDTATIAAVVQRHPDAVDLARLLVELGYVGESQLQTLRATQLRENRRTRLSEAIVEARLLTESRLVHVYADLYGFPLVEPRPGTVDRSLLSRAMTRRYAEGVFVPLRREGSKIVVAFADPLDRDLRAAVRLALGSEIVPTVARRSMILDVIQAFERGARSAVTTDGTSGSSTPGLADQLIRDALTAGASDIHVDPLSARLRVRFRIDGVLVDQQELGKDVAPPLTSRLKVLAGADITEKRRHQGGRFLFEDAASGDAVDVRVSFYATIHGEKIVLRLLNRKAELLNITDIGMPPRMLERFRLDALDVPTGVIIVTGPTGSGKTSTLYSCVDYLNTPETSIITAEDPVEYVIDGIGQCSINPKINLTFEETLRHIVRQDPDVIVLGEIRDRFSAETAIQAALTGHKVLTTFHTEDSIGGLVRLLNMDIEAFLVSSTVISVVAQRLLRRICRECAEPYTPSALEWRRIGWTAEDAHGARFERGRGCPACRFAGYRGRVCVFELLVLNEMVKDAILNRVPSYEIRKISLETSGLVTLLEDGLIKAGQGVTTLAEVIRSLPRLAKPRAFGALTRLTGAA